MMPLSGLPGLTDLNAPKKKRRLALYLAAGATVLAVPALVWVNIGAQRSATDSHTDTVATGTTTTVHPAEPPLYEVADDWQVRGHSRFSDSEQQKQSRAAADDLVIGSDWIPEPKIVAAYEPKDDAEQTTTTRRRITLAEAGVVVRATDPNYLTTTTRPTTTIKGAKAATGTSKTASGTAG